MNPTDKAHARIAEWIKGNPRMRRVAARISSTGVALEFVWERGGSATIECPLSPADVFAGGINALLDKLGQPPLPELPAPVG